MSYGKLITIEGTEGAGKSTALNFIQRYFTERHLSFILTREPGGTPLAEDIRCLLLHHQHAETLTAETELLLMFAARAQLIHHAILPALKNNLYVISDRYIDASYAYQGGGRNIEIEKIEMLDKLVVGNVQPDLTILLDIPVDVGLNRAEKRNAGKDRIEQETMDFFVRVRNAYLDRAKKNPTRIKIVDANTDLINVQKQIEMILNEFIERSAT